MLVRAAISFKLIFLNSEKIFIEKEPVKRCKLSQSNINM